MSTPHDPIAASDVRLRLPVTDLAASTAAYRILLGASGEDRIFAARNGSVELADGGDLRVDLVVADVPVAVTELERRGLCVTAAADGRSADVGAPPVGIAAAVDTVASARGIDHIVLTHADAEAAIAFYAGRLGMSLRRARSLSDDVTQLFFRSRTLVVEVVAGGSMAHRDRFGGIAWRSVDIEADQQHLVEAGLDTSEIRVGRKPGTRVCTVRDRALGAPTLLIEQSPR